MALERMAALESRVHSLVELVQELKRTNTLLQGELRAAKERLMKQEEMGRRWEEERLDIRARIEKVLSELDSLESVKDSKEVVLE
jgi:chromosome segregation ATPase